MEQKKRVIVIGGGAAGLVAAITAAEESAAVTILEQNENPGRKICVTGNGRCNLTNRDMRPELFRGNNPEIARKVLEQFSLEDTWLVYCSQIRVFMLKYAREAASSRSLYFDIF